MTPPPSSKKTKQFLTTSQSDSHRSQLIHEAIQEAYDLFCEEYGDQPSVYRLALISGQSKYFCRQFLKGDDRNPQQANDDRRQKSKLNLQKAFETFVKKNKRRPSVRELAALAKSGHRSVQAYLNALPADLPKRQKSDASYAFLPFGRLTKSRRSQLEQSYQRYAKRRERNSLSRVDVGRLASMTGVDFWTALDYFRQKGVFRE